MKCPRDTNGDGDCGRVHCPACGTTPLAKAMRYDMLVGLIGEIAKDVWDERTLVENASRVLLNEVERDLLLSVVAERLGIRDRFDGSYTDRTFLDQLHTVRGATHMQLLDDLRELAAEIDPHAEERHLGKARDLPAPPYLRTI